MKSPADWIDKEQLVLSTGRIVKLSRGGLGFIRRGHNVYLTSGADNILYDFVDLSAKEKLELLDHAIHELEYVKTLAVQELRNELNSAPHPDRPGLVHELVVRMKEANEIKKRLADAGYR